MLAEAAYLHPVVDTSKLVPPPLITHYLLESSQQPSHIPLANVGFRNVGKTPAFMRKVGAELRLLDVVQETTLSRDVPPALNTLDTVERSDAIGPGETAGYKEWDLGRPITLVELQGVQTKSGVLSKRFYIFGFLEYDDVFGYTTTQRFCLKLTPNGFTPMRGGKAHNSTDRVRVG